ncbi:hypothetical protein EVAR_99853_1 [Eumeta japonica]|uniref:Uncharacterized protein n=1 Tax=Eumeta variegata TaxID=151549 RepID=A0A4C1SCY3_EUMVA|nr:hypothetical protein EVAR_99853_1 [Eumeta japonica]
MKRSAHALHSDPCPARDFNREPIQLDPLSGPDLPKGCWDSQGPEGVANRNTRKERQMMKMCSLDYQQPSDQTENDIGVQREDVKTEMERNLENINFEFEKYVDKRPEAACLQGPGDPRRWYADGGTAQGHALAGARHGLAEGRHQPRGPV